MPQIQIFPLWNVIGAFNLTPLNVVYFIWFQYCFDFMTVFFVISALKKVTADMQTHKNPDLRFNSPQPFKPTTTPKPGAGKAASPTKQQQVKPPRCALEGKKWIVVSKISVYQFFCLSTFLSLGSNEINEHKCNNLLTLPSICVIFGLYSQTFK